MIPLNTLIRPAVSFIAANYGAAGGDGPAALMAAIGLQESKFAARDQLEMSAGGSLVPGRPGPAMSFWQMEKGGGVRGVMRHPASRRAAQDLVEASKAVGMDVDWDEEKIWLFFGTIEGDELAAGFARLLLLTDPAPLPAPTPANEQTAWLYYTRVWRPGKPHPEFWPANWNAALAALRETPTVPVVPSTPGQAASEALSLEQRVTALERKVDALINA